MNRRIVFLITILLIVSYTFLKPYIKDFLESKPAVDPFGKFVKIPPGEFMMGDSNLWGPRHKVKITQGFEMGKYEVTQAQWEAVMESNPSYFKGADLPVEYITWNEAQEFIAKLNKLSKEHNYRLPTEAEWEYACISGTGLDYEGSYGAWLRGNSDGKTHPVGKKTPNSWKLHDMHGNVQEWCQDWYGPYSDKDAVDPKGPETGTERVIRGSDWNSKSFSTPARLNFEPTGRYKFVGFRLARTPR